MLLEYICKERIAAGTMPANPVAVKTIVTTDLVKAIAAKYGVELREVLTGFKFIGEQIGFLEAKGEESRYIFGFEESYGYLAGSYVRDKDAVVASSLSVRWRHSIVHRVFLLYRQEQRCTATTASTATSLIRSLSRVKQV